MCLFKTCYFTSAPTTATFAARHLRISRNVSHRSLQLRLFVDLVLGDAAPLANSLGKPVRDLLVGGVDGIAAVANVPPDFDAARFSRMCPRVSKVK